ncbi:peptidylprolyl isomerase [Akkermansiaceae bacterium]|nr:peptidylprolyl isomerase [Akkermansiaceae bacterium]
MSFFRPFFILALLLSGGFAQANIYAEFTTNRKDAANQPRLFRVLLDPVNAPLAVTHFSLLAGKPDDVWEAGPGAALPVVVPGGFTTMLLGSIPPIERGVERRENIVVRPIVESAGSFTIKEFQIVTQGKNLELGRVSANPNGNIYYDVTGKGRLEMWQETAFPYRWRVAIKYPRPWLEPIFGGETEETFYQNLIVSSPSGQRLFAGTRRIGGKDVVDPGYLVPDELVRVPNIGSANPAIAFRQPFNAPYILAMDNDGPNTNGSQFFITQSTDPTGQEWNGRYTAFGAVFPADRIFLSELITIANANPGTVLITKIEVKRDATYTHAGFFEGYYQNLLPGRYTENVELSMATVNGKAELRAFSPQIGTPESASLLTRIYAGDDLQEYHYVATAGIATGLTEPTKQFVNANLFTGRRGFFRATAWEYPFWPSADVNLENAIYEFTVQGPGGSIGALTLVFNLDGTGGTFVSTTQVERSQYKVNPEWFPGSEMSPILVITSMQPEVQTVRNGSFEAIYSPSQGPYAATIQIEATSGELEIDHIELQYSFNPQDHQSGLPGAQVGLSVPNGFRAYKDEPDMLTEDGWTVIPLEFEGYYYKSQ